VQEFKGLGYFILFIALVLIAVNIGRVVAGIGGEHIPLALRMLLAGPQPERPPLSEVSGT
jgi:hypothetical protein